MPHGKRADAARNRDALVAAATTVLAEKPSASLEDVAKAAGLSRTTVYRHFPAREDLVAAVYVEALEAVSVALAAAKLRTGSVEEALERAVAAMMAAADQHAVLANGPIADVNDPTLLQGYKRAMASVVELIKRGQGEGTLSREMPDWWIADVLFTVFLTAIVNVASGDMERDQVPPLVLRSVLDGARG